MTSLAKSRTVSYSARPIAERHQERIRIVRHELPIADQDLQDQIVQLAGRSSCATPGYVRSRMRIYHYVVAAHTDRLASVQFVQDLQSDEYRGVYLGPAFSRKFYLNLLVSSIEQLCDLAPDRPVHIAGELQNAGLLLAIKGLYGDDSYPTLDARPIPHDIVAVAEDFARQLPHIRGLDCTTFATLADESIAPPDGYLEVHDWLESRGTRLRGGNSQFLVIAIPADSQQRRALLRRVRSRLTSLMSDRAMFTASMLQQFRAAV